MQNPGVHVYREVDPRDHGSIRAAQKQLSHLDTFVPASQAHVTLLGSRFTDLLSKRHQANVLYPLPESADEPIALPVDGFKIFRTRSKAYYTVQLGDPEQVYRDEHLTFQNRAVSHLADAALKDVVVVNTPHVTLGIVEREHSLDVDGEAIISRLPPVITLAPLTMNFVSEAQAHIVQAKKASRTPRKEPVAASEPKVIDMVPLVYRPNGVPAQFLRSLRQATSHVDRDAAE